MKEKIKKVFVEENKFRIIVVLISVFLFALLILSKTLKFPENIGLCHNDGLCESGLFYGIWLPFYNSILYIFISTSSLIFFSKKTFILWAKIMIPVFVIFLFITIVTPAQCTAMICFDRTLIASGFAKLFLEITVLIVFIKTIFDFIVSKKKSYK